jgi:hypothetical protein
MEQSSFWEANNSSGIKDSPTVFLSMTRQSYMGLGLLFSSRFHGHTLLDTPQSVGLLWTRDQLVAETST